MEHYDLKESIKDELYKRSSRLGRAYSAVAGKVAPAVKNLQRYGRAYKGQIAKGAVGGAIGGAVGGALSSRRTPEGERPNLAKNVLKGAIGGGLGGGLGGAAGAALADRSKLVRRRKVAQAMRARRKFQGNLQKKGFHPAIARAAFPYTGKVLRTIGGAGLGAIGGAGLGGIGAAATGGDILQGARRGAMVGGLGGGLGGALIGKQTTLDQLSKGVLGTGMAATGAGVLSRRETPEIRPASKVVSPSSLQPRSPMYG